MRNLDPAVRATEQITHTYFEITVFAENTDDLAAATQELAEWGYSTIKIRKTYTWDREHFERDDDNESDQIEQISWWIQAKYLTKE